METPQERAEREQWEQGAQLLAGISKACEETGAEPIRADLNQAPESVRRARRQAGELADAEEATRDAELQSAYFRGQIDALKGRKAA
jgi:hypothetical protein